MPDLRAAATPTVRGLRFAFLLCFIALCACADRPSIAARATVETFYGAVQNDNLDLANDNIAATASPQFHQRVEATAASAQFNSDVRRSVQLVTVDAPVFNGSNAHVHVVFADGQSDTVTLVREGLRWKVQTTGKMGSGQ